VTVAKISGRGMAWSNVARILADRLTHNDACAVHDPPEPDGCPFCADGDAMRIYREKLGQKRVTRQQERSVTVRRRPLADGLLTVAAATIGPDGRA
jgi:hypothetical protein